MRTYRHVMVCALAVFPGFHAAVAQELLQKEHGKPQICNYTQHDFNRHPQVQDIAQDPRGFLLLATRGPIALLFDRERWHEVEAPASLQHLALSPASARTYAGGVGELGYFSVGHPEELVYSSLVDKIPAALLEDAFEIKDLAVAGGTTYFLMADRVLWHRNDLVGGVLSPNEFELQKLAIIGEQVLIATHGGGLYDLNEGTWTEINPPDENAALEIVAVVPNANALLVATKRNGLFECRPPQGLTPLRVATQCLPTETRIREVVRLEDNRLAVATENRGLTILDETGRVDLHLGLEAGLIDDGLRSAFLDNQGTLWVASSVGVSAVDLHSALERFDSSLGLTGLVQCITRHKGQLYVGTTRGLFRTKPDPCGGPARFARHANLDVPCFALESGEHGLCVATEEGFVWVNNSGEPTRFPGPSIKTLLRSTHHPEWLFLGHRNGLAHTRYTGSSWSAPKALQGIDGNISSIAEGQANKLFLARQNETLEVTFPSGYGSVPTYTVLDHQVGFHWFWKGTHWWRISGQMEKLLDLHPPGNQPIFVPEALFENPENQAFRWILAFDRAPNGNTILATNLGVYFAKTSDDGLPLLQSAQRHFHSGSCIYEVFADPNGDQVYWLADEDGLLRYDADRAKTTQSTGPAVTLTRAVCNSSADECHPGEVRWPVNTKGSKTATFDTCTDEIVFEFAAPWFVPGHNVLYSYRLLGLHSSWSPWSERSTTSFRNMTGGSYRFEVRARAAGLPPGPTTRWAFKVRHSWWKSPLALIVYFALLLSTMITWSALRGRRLAQRNQKLETLVAERTSNLASEMDLAEERAQVFRTIFERSPVGLIRLDLSLLRETIGQLKENSNTSFRDHVLVNPGFLRNQLRRCTLLEANPMAMQILQAPNPDAFRTHFIQNFAGSQEDAVSTLVEGLWNGGSDLQSEIVLPDLRGDLRTLSIRLTVQQGCDETWERVILTLTDETKRIRTEAERRRFERRMLDVQKNDSLGVMAGGIAHDFNNLLTTILGNTELARIETGESSGADHYLEQVENASRRASDLCNQLLAYTGRGQIIIRPVNLSKLVSEMIQIVRSTISRKAEINVHVDPFMPFINADATQLRQVIMNVVTNASEALGDREGEIHIRTETRNFTTSHRFREGMYIAAGEYAVLEVRDTGTGIETEVFERIFEPFFSTKFVGRGLGLAAVLGIVRSHRGGIEVQSESGKGTTITLFFPAIETPDVAPVRTPEALSPAEDITVLVVDDEPEILELAQRALDQVGFTVHCADRGREALRKLRTMGSIVNVVILDYVMPDLGGDEVLTEMTHMGLTTPVVLSSGFPRERVLSNVLKWEKLEFLPKPYSMARLVESVYRALHASEGSNSKSP